MVATLDTLNIHYSSISIDKVRFYYKLAKKSLSKRYPSNQKHHSFDDWSEYSIIQLPAETSKHTRLLIERVLIATASKLFQNSIYAEKPALDSEDSLILVNKKK